ncbi:MAG TPA: HAMP domain-containing sensor histidine kinase [Kofleriaceae bacterium]|nr:HAMP domain-containing sensor histidine kinase [Kofleriaceae bacterium]
MSARGSAQPDAGDQLAEFAAELAARDHFIGYVSHQLRNALTPLTLLVEQIGALAGGTPASPSAVSRAAMLTRNLQRMIATIQWIAEAGDLRRGTLYLEPSAVDLAEIVDEVCRELAAEAATRGAELVIECGSPVVGSWDRARLKQLVIGLVSNAIRHAGGRIELRVVDRGSDAELVVRDHGPGLEPGVLAQLDPFDPDRRRRTGGFGLGLWTIHALASAMRGAVIAINCLEGGARFCVVLPRG